MLQISGGKFLDISLNFTLPKFRVSQSKLSVWQLIVFMVPVTLKNELSGFVLNRIQYSIINECYKLVAVSGRYLHEKGTCIFFLLFCFGLCHLCHLFYCSLTYKFCRKKLFAPQIPCENFTR